MSFSGTVETIATDYRAEARITGPGALFVLNLQGNERAARIDVFVRGDLGDTLKLTAVGHMIPEEGWIFEVEADSPIFLAVSGTTVTISVDVADESEAWQGWLTAAFTQNYSQ